MQGDVLLLGVDGGGTRCRARLTTHDGVVLGAGEAGPANLRLGIKETFGSVRSAIALALRDAGLDTQRAEPRLVACLALAGASEPRELADARSYPHRLLRAVITSDAEAACIGAHAGADGGVVIAGTGSIGWARIAGFSRRVGGWGFPLSDEGSGAWIGMRALRAALNAHDGLMARCGLLDEIFARFEASPQEVVRWSRHARPGDYASLAPIVVAHAAAGDPLARALLQSAADHIEALLGQLSALGAPRLSCVGGLAETLVPYLSTSMRARLTPPEGDALQGALQLAASEARHLLQEAS